MNFPPIPLSRFGPCIVSLSIPLLATTSQAASLHWDGTSTGPNADGGDGTWSTSPNLNWNTGATGGNDVPWEDGSDAIFGGSGGTVSVSGTVSTTTLAFTSAGYSTIEGTITLTGSPVIDTGANEVAIGSILAGSASITKTGSGILTLGGANIFSGMLTIASGTVKAGSNAALGTSGVGSGSGTVVSPGATLDVNGKTLAEEWITISGSGVNGAGSLVNSGAPAKNAVGKLKLAGPSTVGATERWDLRSITSIAPFDMGGHKLTKTGPGAVYLVNVGVSHPGQIDVQQGSFFLEWDTMLRGSASNVITIRNGATLGHSQNNVTQSWTASFENGSTWLSDYRTSSWGGPVTLAGATTITGAAPKGNFATSMDVSGVISGPGSLVKEGPGPWTLSAFNTFTGGTIVNEGALTLTRASLSSGQGTLRGTITVNEGGTLKLPLTNALGTNAGSRVTELTINGGLVEIAAHSSNQAPVLNIASGTLRSNSGNSDPESTSYYVLANDGMVRGLPSDSPGFITGRLHLGAGNTGGTSVFDISRSPATVGVEINAAITEASSGAGLTKQGDGVLALNGPVRYSGITRVEAGTLQLGNTGDLTMPPVVVSDGGKLGMGIVGQTLTSLTVNDGGALLLPAIPGEAITVTGDLSLPSGRIKVSPMFGSDTVAGTYDLISAGAIHGAGIPELDLAGAYGPTRATGTVAVSGNKLQLTITDTGEELVWNNATSASAADGVWDTSLANFSDGHSDSTFQAFDSVTFDDSVAPGNPKTVTLGSTLAPARVRVDNSQGSYTFLSAPGALAGVGSLVKTGGSRLTFIGSNGHAMFGPIVAGGGSIDFSGKAIATSKLVIEEGASFDNAIATVGAMALKAGSAAATLQGSGTWTKTTPGTVTLTANNRLSGAGMIEAGSLIVGDPVTPNDSGSLGTGAVTIASGASLEIHRGDYNPAIANTLTGSGSLELTGTASLGDPKSSFSFTGKNTGFSGPVTVTNAQVVMDPLSTPGQGPIHISDFAALTVKDTASANHLSISTSGEPWGSDYSDGGHLRLSNGILSGPITLTGSANAQIFCMAWTKNTISGAIGESGSVASVYIHGGHRYGSELTIAGNNTYGGFTGIAGMATVNLTGSLGPGHVSVRSRSTLGGNGQIGGSLAFFDTTSLKADMSGDALTVAGNVDLGPATTLKVEVTPDATRGPFPVLRYTGTLTGTAANLIIENAPSYRRANLAFTPGLITLDIGTKELVWRNGTTWNTGTDMCWGTAGISRITDFFFKGDSVIFDDTGSGTNNNIIIGGYSAVSPSSVLVNNNSQTYNIGTPITGPCSITKSGTGILRLYASNSFTGGTFINEGRVEAKNQGTSLGRGPVVVATGATLSGDAQIPGSVTVHGTLDPFRSDGHATLTTGPTVITGTYMCDLDTQTNDRLSVIGDLNLSEATLTLNPSRPLWVSTTSFIIASYSGNLTGHFNTVNGLPPGYVVRYRSAEKQIVLERASLSDWAAGFPDLGNPSASGDPDGDGISNLLEYVLGGNPEVGDPAILPVSSVTDDFYIFRYRRSDASYHHTVQTVQWSTDLINWNDVQVANQGSATLRIDSNGDGTNNITVSLPRTDEAIFARLKVTEK